MPDDYTQPLDKDSSMLNRTVYESKTITDRYLASGNNALFKDCTFQGVLYIKGGLGVNNIRFENCTFNGVIVTGNVAKTGTETWKKNMLYFTGGNTFDNQLMDEMTIMAPGYNVNIGNTHSSEDTTSTLKGVVLGGIVDIRGNINIEGSIISTIYPDPDDWGKEDAIETATNIGYSDENPEASDSDGGTISITPATDTDLPIGISSKILLTRSANSYFEY